MFLSRGVQGSYPGYAVVLSRVVQDSYPGVRGCFMACSVAQTGICGVRSSREYEINSPQFISVFCISIFPWKELLVLYAMPSIFSNWTSIDLMCMLQETCCSVSCNTDVGAKLTVPVWTLMLTSQQITNSATRKDIYYLPWTVHSRSVLVHQKNQNWKSHVIIKLVTSLKQLFRMM